ncbi:MAG: cephalosporin hydroxylase [Nitrosopumilales archaeon]|nr:MAG: cephalosporin hydroxylase [Nitrosopumilales archaeon]
MIDKKFEQKNKKVVGAMIKDNRFRNLSKSWFMASEKYEYSYHFTWLGRPIIQYPQDIIALQEIIWKVKPDLIIETGIAHGGSLIFFASMLELIGHGEVLGIDVDIREHNRIEIEKHPMYKKINMIEGSSISDKVAKKVYKFSRGKKRILLVLDSNHTHEHVLKEMELYSPLVTKGSYMIVFDTVIEDISDPSNPSSNKRPWGKGNNPKTAVKKFLKGNNRFVNDTEIENKLMITVAPCGYLKCIKN